MPSPGEFFHNFLRRKDSDHKQLWIVHYGQSNTTLRKPNGQRGGVASAEPPQSRQIYKRLNLSAPTRPHCSYRANRSLSPVV